MPISLQTGNNFRVVKSHLACLNDDLENDRSVKGLYLIFSGTEPRAQRPACNHHHYYHNLFPPPIASAGREKSIVSNLPDELN